MYVAVFLYVVFIGRATILRYLSLHAHYYDLGIMDQTVYNTAAGRFLELSNPHTLTNTSRLAIHFDPLLAVFAPLYLIFPASPIILLVSQTLVLSLGALALYEIAKRVLESEWLALLTAVLYLGYYPMVNANLFDFHAVTVATAAIPFMFLFFGFSPFKKKWANYVSGLFFLALSILAKENVAVTTACFGLFLMSRKHTRVSGIVVSAISVVSAYVILFRIIPAFNEGGSIFSSYYDFHHPMTFISQVFKKENFIYLFRILFPVGFIPVLAPTAFIMVIPELGKNLLSSNPNMSELYYQYTSVITPVIFISFIYGLRNLRYFVKGAHKIHIWIAVSFIILSFSVVSHLQNGMLFKLSFTVNNPQLQFITKWQHRLSNDGITVAASGSIAPFFTERKNYIDFFFDPTYESGGLNSKDELAQQKEKYKQAKYVLLYNEDIHENDPLQKEYLHSLQTDANYHVADQGYGITVYEK